MYPVVCELHSRTLIRWIGKRKMRFDDYHRTIVGYHGTRLSTALGIVNRTRRFRVSQNRDDWLGHGVYFWEYAPQQAYWWAERRRKRQKWDEPIAILGSMIRLGFCFDLLDPYNVTYLREIYDAYRAAEAAAGRAIRENANHYKYLDCAVFQYAYAVVENSEGQSSVDQRVRSTFRLATRNAFGREVGFQTELIFKSALGTRRASWVRGFITQPIWRSPMPPKRQKLPRTSSSLKIKRAVEKLKAMTIGDQVQLLVQAKLMTQAEADERMRNLSGTRARR